MAESPKASHESKRNLADRVSEVLRGSSRVDFRAPDGFSIGVESRTFDELRLRISGKINTENAESFRAEVIKRLEAEPLRNPVLDLGGVEYFDSSGAAVLIEVDQRCKELDNSLKLENVAPGVQHFLDLVNFDQYESVGVLQPRTEPNLLIQIGEGTLALWQTTQDILTFIGASVVALGQDLSNPRKLRWDRLWKLIERNGSDAVPIVTALGFLMGAILAFQAAIQLRKFGANIFVADLVSVSICVEMGPLLTALIVAGRSGAAFAAEIGTMQVTEEVDALRVMAIDPVRYLVSPRILAVAFVLPCLTLFADIVGMVGGCVVAVLSLDLTPTTYFNQVATILEVSDIAKGVTKSFVFGIEIAMVGCMKGFQAQGGADSVGSAATSAVVTSIFVIVMTDAVFSMFYHYVPLA